MTYPKERETQILIDHYSMDFIIETSNKTVTRRMLGMGYKPSNLENLTNEEIIERDERVIFRFDSLANLKRFANSGIFKAS